MGKGKWTSRQKSSVSTGPGVPNRGLLGGRMGRAAV